MAVSQTGFSGPEPPLDYLITYTQGAITKQSATVERLADQGHDLTDAAKRLTEMVVNLAALMQKKRAGR